MAQGTIKPVRSISWEVGIESTDGAEKLILRRDVMRKQMDAAAGVCVLALSRHFSLSDRAVDAIDATMDGTHSWITFGQEGRSDESGVYPVGVLKNDVVDLKTRAVISSDPAGYPEVRVSIEGVAEEASNLKRTAIKIVKDGKHDSVSERTKEVLDAFIEDEQALINAASRVAAARRLIRYVILPNGSLRGEDLNIGFDTWFSEQFGRRGGKKPSKKAIDDIKINYAESEIALKNVRRSAWVPIFFSILDIDFGDFGFYLGYRQQLARNNGYTVTFSSPLSVLLEQKETTEALERIFEGSGPTLKAL